MEEILALLKDGRSRSVEMLAKELGTSPEDIRRKIEFLEQAGIIRRLAETPAAASPCAACHGSSSCAGCPGCCPAEGLKNMGTRWVVQEA